MLLGGRFFKSLDLFLKIDENQHLNDFINEMFSSTNPRGELERERKARSKAERNGKVRALSSRFALAHELPSPPSFYSATQAQNSEFSRCCFGKDAKEMCNARAVDCSQPLYFLDANSEREARASGSASERKRERAEARASGSEREGVGDPRSRFALSPSSLAATTI